MLVAAIAGAIACGGANPVPVHTWSVDASSLARHRTYAHEAGKPPSDHTVSARSTVVIEKARPHVDAEMQRRGFVLVPPEEADLVVRIASGTRTEEESPTGAAAVVGAPTSEDRMSVLFVDIVERATGKFLLHGRATKEVYNGKVDDREVEKAVKEIFEEVPFTSAGTSDRSRSP